jgi:Ca-activated chloride channel homolog
MPHRIPNPSRLTRTPFGLVAWLEQTRVQLPLKGVECRFAVCGDLLNVEIDQIFHQNTAQPLDCLYTFPLPGGAAVHRCEMHVNGRVVRAKVEEVAEARRLVQEKKAAGHRTALVEMDRENLFTLSLGNVQPEDVIVVRFAYFQTLTRLEDWTSLQIPFCPGVRYIPGTPLLRSPKGRGVADDTDQVPDASRISPPRIDRLHRDAAYLSVEGTVQNPLGHVRDVSSPSHPVLVRDGELQLAVTLADRAAVPDSDFVLRWTETAVTDLAALGWVCRDGEASHALLRLVAPPDAPVSDNFGQDIYFLVDRSGSMQGMKWQKAAHAFREFLKTLGPKDRVWATFFESTFRDLAEKPLPAADLLADPSVQHIERFGTAGGTELLPALRHVLKQVAKHSSGQTASLLLITDGQVGNEAEILRELRAHPGLRVHTFGVDTAVNDAFLKQMAAQQRGTCYLVTPNDDIVGTVARLGLRLRRPVLTSLALEEGWQMAGESLPDLHAGEVVSLSLAGPARAGTVTIHARLPDGAAKSFSFSLAVIAEPALRLLWARQRIDHLQQKGDRQAALALAKAANLICDGAAFVAWDEEEKVAVSAADREIYQPAMSVAQYCTLGTVDFLEDNDTVLSRDACVRLLSEQCQTSTRKRLSSLRVSSERREPPLSFFQRFIRLLKQLGRQGERWPDHPVFKQAFSHWRREMLELLPEPAIAERVLALLQQWAESEPDTIAERLASLDALMDDLRRSLDPLTVRLRLLHDWVEAHVQQPADLRQRLLEMLADLARVTGYAGPSGGAPP